MPNKKARQLRRDLTDAERRLWKTLRGRHFNGYKFRRQHPIGVFIADFACVEKQVIIEADGGQHADNSADIKRTEWLEKQGWRVVRFWNNDILTNTTGVLEMILRELQSDRGGPSPSPNSGQSPEFGSPPSPARAREGRS